MQTEDYLIPLGTGAERIVDDLDGSLTLSVAASETFTTTYWDTADWRIYRDGGLLETVRVGRKSETLWRRRENGDEVARWAGKCPGFAWDFPEGEGRNLLEPVIIMRALLPMVTVRGTLRRAAVLNGDDKTVARIEAVDLDGKKSGVPLPGLVRILPVRGYDADFAKLKCAITTETRLAKMDRDRGTVLFEALGIDYGVDPNKIDVSFKPEMKAGSAVKSVLLHLLDIMEANSQGVIDDVDTEFLHEFRVAVRRSRSALVPFKDCFQKESFARFKDDLSWLGRDTGDPRDMDVWLLKFPNYKAMLPDEVKPQLDPLGGFLKKKRNASYAKLRRDLKTKRYDAFVRDWRNFLEADGPQGAVQPMAEEPVSALADKWIGKFYKRLIKEGSAIDPQSPAEALHDLRKTCKKFRYQIDFFASLYPKTKFKSAVKELKRLQENLGDFQDLEVQADSLRGFASEMIEKGGKDGEVYLAMGMLVSDLLQRQAEVRKEFGERFDRFAGEQNRALFNELFIDKQNTSNQTEETGA